MKELAYIRHCSSITAIKSNGITTKRSMHLQRRIRGFVLVSLMSIAVLTTTLFYLQILRGAHYAQRARDSRVRTLTVEGARGRITDRYGRTLAGTALAYEALLSPSDVSRDQLNQSIFAALMIINNAGVTPACTIPIEQTEQGYTYTGDVEAFLKEQKLSPETSAAQAVDALLLRYEAQAIPEDALLGVLAVRLQLSRQSYRAYRPVRIAQFETPALCAQFAENNLLMPGVTIEAVPARTYPYGETFCHGLGFLGKISAEEAEAYTEKGYDIYTDIVGKSGLESLFEPLLRPSAGEVTVSVDSLGRRNAVLSETPATDGQDVVLTLDANLQATAEQSLDDTMAKIRSGALGERFPNARIGAAVAIDVSNGEVLAMASTPGYDPNVFMQRLDDAAWQALNPEYLTAAGNVDRDPTLPRPLVNNAITNAFAPGSVFKPVTALAALESGVVTAEETIYDAGRYTHFSTTDAPACWTWNDSSTTHGLVNIKDAMAVSCNYFFYEMGVRTGSQALEAMARRLGLGTKSGLGLLGETEGTLDSQAHSSAACLRKALEQMRALRPDFDEGAATDATNALLENPSLENAHRCFSPLGFTAAEINALYAQIDQYRWRPSRILAAAIGQGDTAVTVVQMANAIAAITQQGKRYTPRLVQSLPDEGGEIAPTVACEAFLRAASVETVMDGMHDAVRTGTARRPFEGCTIDIAGKTGTAQSTGRDAFAWFVAYAPADNPRVAVAVMIAQGGHGTYAAPVARAILEAYFAPGLGTQAPCPQDLLP